MSIEKQRSNRETKKPKKAVPKTNASAPSQKNTVSAVTKKSDRT